MSLCATTLSSLSRIIFICLVSLRVLIRHRYRAYKFLTSSQKSKRQFICVTLSRRNSAAFVRTTVVMKNNTSVVCVGLLVFYFGKSIFYLSFCEAYLVLGFFFKTNCYNKLACHFQAIKFSENVRLP